MQKDFFRAFVRSVKPHCSYVKSVLVFYGSWKDYLSNQKYYTKVRTGLGKLQQYAANNENKMNKIPKPFLGVTLFWICSTRSDIVQKMAYKLKNGGWH